MEIIEISIQIIRVHFYTTEIYITICFYLSNRLVSILYLQKMKKTNET